MDQPGKSRGKRTAHYHISEGCVTGATITRPDKEGWIFSATQTDTKTPYRRDMRIAFARCVTRAGMNPKQCTPHIMRHTAITRLVKAGADLMTIKRISGHKTTAMVEHYTHIHGTHVDEAIANIDIAANGNDTQELHKGDEAA